MGKYRSLRSIFHEFDLPTAEQEARARRAVGFETGFELGGHSLFYVPTPHLLLLQEEIFLNERKLGGIVAGIPVVAWRSYLRELITREITATNEIEGVRSTRQEIEEALDAQPEANRKFREIAKLYLELSQKSVEPPQSLAELREMYDSLFGGEIAADDALDGELFRAGAVYIYGGAGERIHSGATDEAEIRRQLQAMLDHLASPDVPFLLSRVVAHFMFEAVHPFYDGNGRFGRFLLSVQLQDVLSVYTVLTLSRMISLKKAEYYRAFTETEHRYNFADATLFAQTMLGFIRDSQWELIEDITAKKERLEALAAQVLAIGEGDSELSAEGVNILFLLGQVYLFGSGGALDLDTLAEVSGRSKSTIRRYVSEVETAGLVERVSSRPLRLRLSRAGLTLLKLVSA